MAEHDLLIIDDPLARGDAPEKPTPPALESRYWIVLGWRPRMSGRTEHGKPFYRHATEEGAMAEAQRLADLNGTRFRVFEAKGTAAPRKTEAPTDG
jgi:hypothetical protein